MKLTASVLEHSPHTYQHTSFPAMSILGRRAAWALSSCNNSDLSTRLKGPGMAVVSPRPTPSLRSAGLFSVMTEHLIYSASKLYFINPRGHWNEGASSLPIYHQDKESCQLNWHLINFWGAERQKQPFRIYWTWPPKAWVPGFPITSDKPIWQEQC